jgi:hypothetical protein
MMSRRPSAWLVAAWGVLALPCLTAVTAAVPRVSPSNDLDAFMQQVLARRDDNWKKLQQYVLDEREEIDVRGPSHTSIWGERSDYSWYLRDGFFVRSPLTINGVTLGEAERRKYEADFLRREQRRDAGPQGDRPPNQASAAETGDAPLDVNGLVRQTHEPQFISSAYILRFKFEEGHYALVGRETLHGREVLRIEYYPARLFMPTSERRSSDRSTWDPAYDAQLQRLMNKASLVTLWIDPVSHQIVRYTLDNVTSNFLPANWLGRVADAHASMDMEQAFPDVWLPGSLELQVALALAVGDFNLRYALYYSDYRRADASTTLHVPDVLP